MNAAREEIVLWHYNNVILSCSIQFDQIIYEKNDDKNDRMGLEGISFKYNNAIMMVYSYMQFVI